MKGLKTEQFYAVLLTGLSGAGKTVALNALEDSGFFCVDNLPVTLIKTFINLCSKTPGISKVAIGVDIRGGKFLSDFSNIIPALKKKYRMDVVFLEAAEESLLSRFKETRRPHPLGLKDIKKAAQKEKAMLSPIIKEADRIIDTSKLTPHQLREFIISTHIGETGKKMAITLISFGYKYGIPLEADLLFDVRFLPNPFFVKELKKYPGTSSKIKNYVMKKEETKKFLNKLYPFLKSILPLYVKEGKSYLTIGIGCTGGMHRSPVIAEDLKNTLKKQKLNVSVIHRDLALS
ncbi:MAG: RNase adapter RapZ [Nitrospirae bacterium]|nr:RNase adapter RapZ [Nitrospirota bacterium]